MTYKFRIVKNTEDIYYEIEYRCSGFFYWLDRWSYLTFAQSVEEAEKLILNRLNKPKTMKEIIKTYEVVGY